MTSTRISYRASRPLIGGLLVLSLTSCTSPGKKTAVGAGGGAAAGAIMGAVAGGWKGAAIGAAAGAAVGGAIGNRLDKQAKELGQVADTQRTQDGILVKLKNDLLFDTGSSILKPEAVDEISKLGDVLIQYPDDHIKIMGHTDSTGKAANNEALSTRRADAVKAVLVSRGVKENQMLVLGMGQSKPIADNKTPAGRAQNRRVELHIDMPEDKQGTKGG